MRNDHGQRLSTDYEVELLNIHNAFHQGQYTTVIDFDTSSLSSENKTPARILQLRAQIAIGQAKEVLTNIGREGDAPDFAAVKAVAQYSLGSSSDAISEIEDLIETSSENTTVQLLGGTVLQAAGKTEEALSLLSKHQGSLEAYEIQPYPYHLIRLDAKRLITQDSSYRADSSSAEQDRYCPQGSPSSTEMGPR